MKKEKREGKNREGKDNCVDFCDREENNRRNVLEGKGNLKTTKIKKKWRKEKREK